MSQWQASDLYQLSDERDRYLARIIAAEREGYRLGFAAGHVAGIQDALQQVALQQRMAADHLMPLLLSPSDTRLTILRYAPRGWHGRIPKGIDGARLRRWLAAIPRKGDHARQAAGR